MNQIKAYHRLCAIKSSDSKISLTVQQINKTTLEGIFTERQRGLYLNDDVTIKTGGKSKNNMVDVNE